MNMGGPVLRDIHVPAASWWPPAPGWWLFALLVIVIATCVAWWIWRRARLRPLRAALREIDGIAIAFSRDHANARFAADCSRLLRRVALHVDPAVAAMHGEAWRAFLHRHSGAENTTALDALLDSPFRKRPVLDAQAVIDAMRLWCKRELHSPSRFLYRRHALHTTPDQVRGRLFDHPLPARWENETGAERLAGGGQSHEHGSRQLAP